MTGGENSDDERLTGRLSRRNLMLLGGGAAVTTVGGAAAVTTGMLGPLTGGSTGSSDEDDSGGATDAGNSEGANDGETGGSGTTNSDDTVIAVGSTQLGSGETGTVPVTLESAPNGTSGFKLTVAIETAVATITDATIDEKFPLSSATVAEDGSAVTLKAAGQVDEGATDVRLATVTTQGVDAGSTALEVTVELFDDADGNSQSPKTTDGEVTVE